MSPSNDDPDNIYEAFKSGYEDSPKVSFFYSSFRDDSPIFCSFILFIVGVGFTLSTFGGLKSGYVFPNFFS